jgi:hypothetical protein
VSGSVVVGDPVDGEAVGDDDEGSFVGCSPP